MTWPTKKLGEIAQIVTGKLNVNQADKNGAYPFYSCSDEVLRINATTFDGESILIAGNGDFWVKYHQSGKFNAYQRTYVVTNQSDETITKYLYFVISTQTPKFKKMAQGGIIKFLHLGQLQNLKIPLPPLETQQKIVERLDAIKKAQELNDKQIALADELFQSLLERELSLKNKNRKIKNLRDLVNVKGGKRVPKGKRLLESKTSHPYIRVIDFKDFSVDTRDIKYIDQKTHEIIKNYTVEGNDIYVSIAGTTGVVGLIPEELSGANLTENAVKLILKDENVDRKFLTFFLSSNFGQNQLKRNTYAPGVPKLAIYRLENTKIPLPPLENQRQIVEKLQAVQDYKKKLLEQKQKFKELFNSCLDKAMKGELVS